MASKIIQLLGGGVDGEDGLGIKSIEQTTTSTEDGGVNVVTLTLTDNSKFTFEIRNGSKGAQGEKGEDGDGKNGADGNGISSAVLNADYTLTLNFTDGTSYTTPTSIRGAKGDKGDTGAQGEKGEKGDKGDTGAQGAKGDKGDKGDTGAAGAKGADGYTPVKGTDYFTAADKQEIVNAVLANFTDASEVAM